MNRLILIRHAQSEHHVRGLTGGWTDTPLSGYGKAQAALLAGRCRRLLTGTPAPRLFSSDLRRAGETAAAIAAALGVTCEMEPALRELNNGAAAGLTTEAARSLELPPTEPAIDWLPYPGAESWRAMTERVFAGMERIAAACPGTAIVVTHGNTGIAVIQWFLRLGEHCREGISFELDPASMSVLSVNGWGERTLVTLNDTSHLGGLTEDGPPRS